MKGQIRNMQTVAREIRNNRRNAAQASKEFRVYQVKKNGELYAKPVYYVATEQEANDNKARLEKLNPGSKYQVV